MSEAAAHPSVEELEAEIAELRARLMDAEQTIEAIRSGEVDALVVETPEGERIFSLAGADRPYRALIEQMQEGAVMLARDGDIQYCNKAFGDLLEKPLETMIGGSIAQHVRPEDKSAFGIMLQQSLSTDTQGEIGLLRTDGSVVPAYLSLNRIIDSGHESICVVITNLTERKRAERITWEARERESLAQQLAELDAIYRTAPVGLCVLDRELRYVRINERYAEMNGIPAKLHLGRKLREVVPDFAEVAEPLLERIITTGQPVRDVQLHGETPSQPGVRRIWIEHLHPVFAAGGEVVGVSVVAEEVTERLRTEAALREADHRKDLFLATLAHELRNPLAPIRNAAQILASSRLTPQQLQWAQSVIQRQVGHMALLLDDLLDIARITQGKLLLKPERVKLTDIVDAAVEAARPLIDGRHHSFVVSLPAEELSIEGDPLRLSQVLSNLLTNAAKYTDPGGHIKLVGTTQSGMLCLSVKDDGIGIRPESLERIFGMFSQAEGTAARSDGGLGIGLALVKGLVELHGGTIEARSDGPGLGSEFIVRLPLGAPHPLAVTVPNVDSAPASAKGRRVLVADDNKDAAESLGVLLELAGHEVRVAHGGRAALSLAQSFRPNVALLDIGMPDVSGYVIARELRREPWGAGIYLIALTGWGQDEDRQRAREAGFDKHLTKPIDPEVLESLLHSERAL